MKLRNGVMPLDDIGVPRPKKRSLPRWLKFILMLLGFLFLVEALLWVIADRQHARCPGSRTGPAAGSGFAFGDVEGSEGGESLFVDGGCTCQ